MTAFNPSSTMMALPPLQHRAVRAARRLRDASAACGWRRSPRAARASCERTASRARGIGLDAEVIGADEARRADAGDLARRRCTARSTWPATATSTRTARRTRVADAARALGVRIRHGRPRDRASSCRPGARSRRVLTDAGPIDTELVVNAAGMWAPQVAAMVGAFIPSTPVDHQHIALQGRARATSCRATCPASATRTTSSTARASTAGWSSAATSSTRVSRWEDGVPWDHAARSLPPDWERFAPLMAGAIRRFPFLADAEAIRLVCHPGRDDARTRTRCSGRCPASAGSGSPPGCRSTGSAAAAGSGGRSPAGSRPAIRASDIGPYRAWRFADTYRDPAFAAGLGARDVLATTTGCATRSTRTWRAGRAGCRALHGRLQEAGAVFGTKAGWERADHHEPGRPWRRAGRDQAALRLDAAAVVRARRAPRAGPSASGPGSST